jgi:endo-alpha-1,4-polygalactosaminidase (GH114 family)
MKGKLLIKIILILIVLCLVVIVYINANKKPNELENISNYRIYYRKIDKDILKSMSSYDLNIVEGSFFDSEDVEYLNEKGSKVVGYYSVMEIGSWDASLIEKLDDMDYLKKDGVKVKSLSGSNYICDISKCHFQDALIDSISERVMAKGMDGVFLDTVDWIDYFQDDEILYPILLKGYGEFLEKLKARYPDIIVIQNRGLYAYENLSCSYVDGILWENFSSPYVEDDESAIDRLKKVRSLSRRYNTAVFTISFDEGHESEDLSTKLGWVHLQSQMEDRYSKWDIETHSQGE